MTFGYHPETGIRRQLIPVTPAPALYEVPLHRAPSTLKSVSWYSCAAVSQASPTGLGTSWMLYKHSCVAWMVLEWRCKKQTGATVKPGNRDMVVPRAGGGGGGAVLDLLQVRQRVAGMLEGPAQDQEAGGWAGLHSWPTLPCLSTSNSAV